jgi:exoribonuclease R
MCLSKNAKRKSFQMVMNSDSQPQRTLLQNIAHRAMIEKGLLPDFTGEALAELNRLQVTKTTDDESHRDLRNLLWCSIDNDDSRDLD